MCSSSKPPKPKPRPVIQPPPEQPVQPVSQAAPSVKIGADTSTGSQPKRKKATRSSLRQSASSKASSEPSAGLGS
jgi:hypothetical protein